MTTGKPNVPAAVDVLEIRKRLSLTQRQFAEVFAIPYGTVRDWEQGKRQPDAAARAYLCVIDRATDAVRNALAQR